MNQNLIDYYNYRADEYDKVYSIPEEQEDLKKSIKIFQNLFASKKAMEVACGTGYWTKHIAMTATSVYATDINKSMVSIARERAFFNNVTIEVKDMYGISSTAKYDAFFGGFIWSHVLIQDLDALLFKAKSFLNPDGVIVFIDSKPVSNTAHDKKNISHIDEHGNTFQTRQLENGTLHEVLKNFPSKKLLEQKLSLVANDIQYIDLDHYWIIVGKGMKY